MNKNYLTYPCKTMRITQNYNGKTSHKPHTTGNPKDYPIDEGGKDSGRDGLYCDCDEMKIVRLYGVGNGGTNTLWVESTSKVHFADGTRDYACGMAIHPNDSDFKSLYVGKKFKRGDLICREGSDGATANHLHISFGKGKLKGNGWIKNSNGKYVLNCTGGACKPEKLFYIDPSFTKVLSKGGIAFKELPQEYTAGYYKVNTAVLNVRKGAGTNFAKAGTLIKGKKIKIIEVDGIWGRIGKNKWVCLEYCRKV
ncbi:MAG: SH3 domain-containing protein [Clostridia bacterium]|nr:SH3 domain-containing protein [Clostridia bacterium]